MDEQNRLSAKEISVIVGSCGKAGVKSLEYRDLKISFFGQETATSHAGQEGFHYQVHDHGPTDPPPSTTADDEENLELLAVENPVAWERLKTQGDI